MLSQRDQELLRQQEQANQRKKVKYPRSVAFIIGTEFCERFSYYGMKAILTLYLHNELRYSEDDSTVIYHVWSMLCYFTPILGAIIADTFLGRFRTIFYISIVYVLGNAVLSVSAVPPVFPELSTKIGPFEDLVDVCLESCGIFNGGNFHGNPGVIHKGRHRAMAYIYNIYFYAYSSAIFVAGYLAHLYKLMPPQGSVLTDVWCCIWHALGRKIKSKESKEHWLDHAEDKYDKDLISDVKILVKILLLYIPLPFFWALFDQQGSRWTFQATRMDGQIGSWTLKPDQMQVVNPLFILLFIPVFDTFVYPLLARCNLLKRQLPRMFTGGILAGVAFLVSGCLELKLETTFSVALQSGETRVTFINGLPCDIALNVTGQDPEIKIPQLQEHIIKSIMINEANTTFNVTLEFDEHNCGNVRHGLPHYEIVVHEETAHAIMITADSTVIKMVNIEPPDDYMKSDSGLPKLRMLYNLDMVPFNSSVRLKGKFDTYDFFIEDTPQGHTSGTKFMEVEPGSYQVFLPTLEGIREEEAFTSFDVKLGGVYNFLVQKSLINVSDAMTVNVFEVTPSNSVHIMWLIPQYFIITVSEIMFSITGLEFSFTQSPSSMKSVLQAAWLLTVSFGNLIVVIIAEAKFFKSQAMEFFLFAVLMFVDMIIFAALAVSYKYVDELAEAKATSGAVSDKEGIDNKVFSDDETKF
ncbi:peptide transporter family 1-like [Cherax quadricarinatus]